MIRTLLIKLQVNNRKGNEFGYVIIGHPMILVEIYNSKEIRRHSRPVYIFGSLLDDHKSIIHYYQIEGAQNSNGKQGG